MTFEEQRAVYLTRCEEALSESVNKYFTVGSQVREAAEYSLLNGGKRVRGILSLAVCDLLDGNQRAAEIFAAAIEMVHSFSLIHDDLPCMDDDDMRRGKPSNHKVFGEATALLAGDALAVAALESLCAAPLPPDMLVLAVKTLAQATGDRGMIHGQELDLKYETEPADEDVLLRIHRDKTGALIRAGTDLGIVAASRVPAEYAPITKYADNIGMTFQIIDDILDSTSSDEVLGKPVGSDLARDKTTFVTLYGIDASRQQANRLTEEAIVSLRNECGEKSEFLCKFAENLVERLH